MVDATIPSEAVSVSVRRRTRRGAVVTPSPSTGFGAKIVRTIAPLDERRLVGTLWATLSPRKRCVLARLLPKMYGNRSITGETRTVAGETRKTWGLEILTFGFASALRFRDALLVA